MDHSPSGIPQQRCNFTPSGRTGCAPSHPAAHLETCCFRTDTHHRDRRREKQHVLPRFRTDTHHRDRRREKQHVLPRALPTHPLFAHSPVHGDCTVGKPCWASPAHSSSSPPPLSPLLRALAIDCTVGHGHGGGVSNVGWRRRLPNTILISPTISTTSYLAPFRRGEQF